MLSHPSGWMFHHVPSDILSARHLWLLEHLQCSWDLQTVQAFPNCSGNTSLIPPDKQRRAIMSLSKEYRLNLECHKFMFYYFLHFPFKDGIYVGPFIKITGYSYTHKLSLISITYTCRRVSEVYGREILSWFFYYLIMTSVIVWSLNKPLSTNPVIKMFVDKINNLVSSDASVKLHSIDTVYISVTH